MTNMGVHLTQLIIESVKASIHVLKLCHNGHESHTTHGGRRCERGWIEMGWKSCHFGLWPFRLKLGLALSNGHRANGIHNGEMRRLRRRNKGVANDPHDCKREDKLITGCCVSINIDERENEVRREVYGKILNKGKKKASIRLSNRVIVSQRMKNECHYHVKEPRTFCKA